RTGSCHASDQGHSTDYCSPSSSSASFQAMTSPQTPCTWHASRCHCGATSWLSFPPAWSVAVPCISATRRPPRWHSPQPATTSNSPLLSPSAPLESHRGRHWPVSSAHSSKSRSSWHSSTSPSGHAPASSRTSPPPQNRRPIMPETTPTTDLPVAVIGAGPTGLAAAAHLVARGIEPVVFEAGSTPAAAVLEWGHIGLFSPWKYNIDQAARTLLESTDWQEPDGYYLPTGAELVGDYLAPLAGTPQLRESIHTSTRVIAVSRAGMDRTRTPGRETAAFLVRVQSTDGQIVDHKVRAVIVASGTWETTNPLGQAGLPAIGETTARDAGLVTSPLPDVLGRDREQFAGRHTLVVGAGHSAANTLLALGQLGDEEPCTRISWVIRGADPASVYGGGDQDGLPARGALGSRLRHLVESGQVEVHTSMT